MVTMAEHTPHPVAFEIVLLGMIDREGERFRMLRLAAAERPGGLPWAAAPG